MCRRMVASTSKHDVDKKSLLVRASRSSDWTKRLHYPKFNFVIPKWRRQKLDVARVGLKILLKHQVLLFLDPREYFFQRRNLAKNCKFLIFGSILYKPYKKKFPKS